MNFALVGINIQVSHRWYYITRLLRMTTPAWNSIMSSLWIVIRPYQEILSTWKMLTEDLSKTGEFEFTVKNAGDIVSLKTDLGIHDGSCLKLLVNTEPWTLTSDRVPVFGQVVTSGSMEMRLKNPFRVITTHHGSMVMVMTWLYGNKKQLKQHSIF